MPKHPWSKELSIYAAKHWGDGLREEVEWSCVAYMQAVPPNAAEAEGGEAAYERRENGVMLFHHLGLRGDATAVSPVRCRVCRYPGHLAADTASVV